MRETEMSCSGGMGLGCMETFEKNGKIGGGNNNELTQNIRQHGIEGNVNPSGYLECKDLEHTCSWSRCHITTPHIFLAHNQRQELEMRDDKQEEFERAILFGGTAKQGNERMI